MLRTERLVLCFCAAFFLIFYVVYKQSQNPSIYFISSLKLHFSTMNMNPINKSGVYEDEDYKKKIIGQMEVPLYKKTHRFAPWLLKCDGKIVKYDIRGLGIWRALFSFSHTILSDWDTWNHLNMLTVICFVTMAICILSGSYKSIEDENSVTGRIQTLISFIFASYVTLVINRWDRIRNTTLGQLWGSLENLNMVVFKILKTSGTGKDRTDSSSAGAANETTQEQVLVDRFIRYSRLIFKLTFLAVQNEDNLEPLIDSGLLTEKEMGWLKATLVGTRPLVVCIWIENYFDTLSEAGYRISDIQQSLIANNVTSLRGGIGATLGAIGTQLPYAYVHLVYWTIQILLASLAVETGVVLATNVFYKVNGGGFYSPPDDNVSWPAQPNVWYINDLLQITASNIIFALFCEGALKICDKLTNPMSLEDSSFSERVYDAFLFNNCQAMRSAHVSYKTLDYEPLVPLSGDAISKGKNIE